MLTGGCVSEPVEAEAAVAERLAVAQTPQSESPDQFSSVLQRADEVWLGDFEGMLERRRFRVLVPYNRATLFLDSKGHPRGFALDLLREYAKALNKGRSRREARIAIAIIPVAHDQLLPMLAQGRGDIAAGLLTISAERHPGVVFTQPYLDGVSEVVVAHRDAAPLKGAEDLSDRDVLVVSETTYTLSLQALNNRLESAGRPPVRVRTARHLETEDVLRLVDSGVFEYTVADDYLASLWSRRLNDIRVEPVQLRTRAALGWAVRSENRTLLENLNEFVRQNRKGTLIGNVVYRRYFESADWLDDSIEAASEGRLGELVPIFQKYGRQYELDWVALLAVAYQESGLRPDLKSRAGAVGLMQIRPETAEAMGFSDALDADSNIHAATRYFVELHERYFADSGLEPVDVFDLILAGYNAGPSRINRLRRVAASEGLDPNRWFSNVEVIARREIGRETVEYVTGVNNLYLALSQVRDTLLLREAEIEELRAGQ